MEPIKIDNGEFQRLRVRKLLDDSIAIDQMGPLIPVHRSALPALISALQAALPAEAPKEPKPPKKYAGVTCRGSYVLGTACERCEKCADERRAMATVSKGDGA